MEKTINSQLDILEKSMKEFIIIIVRPFFVFFGKFKRKNREKTKEVLKEYNDLIREFQLIQKKESKLSYNERVEVNNRVMHLVSKGHIKLK